MRPEEDSNQSYFTNIGCYQVALDSDAALSHEAREDV